MNCEQCELWDSGLGGKRYTIVYYPLATSPCFAFFDPLEWTHSLRHGTVTEYAYFSTVYNLYIQLPVIQVYRIGCETTSLCTLAQGILQVLNSLKSTGCLLHSRPSSLTVISIEEFFFSPLLLLCSSNSWHQPLSHTGNKSRTQRNKSWEET